VAYIAWALVVIAAFACGAYLAVNGHPWLALGVLVTASGYSVKENK
jgi:hypothetical protein